MQSSPHEHGLMDDEVLLIMERPENCMNLFDYNNGQIDEGLAKEFMRQLVEAAIQIHKAAVFHHDLKPENILIQFYDAWHIPRVRVIDFGCGWFVTPGYCSYSGTYCFRPPEFKHRGIYEAGPTTVWQLGCILLQLLSENTDLFIRGMQHCEHFLMYTIMELKVTEEVFDELFASQSGSASYPGTDVVPPVVPLTADVPLFYFNFLEM
ncbi:serine/threonine-protein kinase pim-2-like [Takifugu flavidus]|uniref:serine/threonine-protein kinase pim-2-like n=1 Tax=Takifugu flavidus TaxID=433684 RepID=UPI002544C6EB|nr:serine/threonine-protein kinase pim-2-like [Takifugu flavidus]XP_056872806.1 serine/threonine-protein kinase pim-2-like [Takifugu flavidus]